MRPSEHKKDWIRIWVTWLCGAKPLETQTLFLGFTVSCLALSRDLHFGNVHLFILQIYNIKTWTGRSVEESTRMTEDRDKWRKYVHGVANPWIEDG